nr:T3SS effector HopA1 family protein [Rathayibacter iranicus]
MHRIRVRFKADVLTEEEGAQYARLSCLRPNLTPGFFMFLHERADRPAAPGTMLRHYLRFDDPDQALRFWAASVRELVDRNLSFRTKILSRPDAFPRNDSIVYYSSADAGGIGDVLRRLVPSSGASTEGSPLCAEIVPGVRMAAEPVRSGREQSFGESRCAALAGAIAATVTSGGALVDRIRDALAEARIDPDNVARNLAPSVSEESAA